MLQFNAVFNDAMLSPRTILHMLLFQDSTDSKAQT